MHDTTSEREKEKVMKRRITIMLAAAMTLQTVNAVPAYGAQIAAVSESPVVAEEEGFTVNDTANASDSVSANTVTILAKEKIDLKELFFKGESVSKFELADKSKKKIAGVSKKGILTGKKDGEVVVNAIIGSETKTCTVKVIKPKKTKKLKLKKNSQFDLSELLGITDDSLSAQWKVKTSKKTQNIVKFKKADDDKVIIKDNGSAKIEGTFGEKGKRCKMYVLNHVDDTVWLKARAFNQCVPEGIEQRYWFVCSFYGLEEASSETIGFNVIPNPNDGQMKLVMNNTYCRPMTLLWLWTVHGSTGDSKSHELMLSICLLF